MYLMDELRKHLLSVFHGYQIDPADSDFQRGYLAGLIGLYEGFFTDRPALLTEMHTQVNEEVQTGDDD